MTAFPPDPDALVSSIVEAVMRGVRVAVVAQVEAYTAAQQTADITPLVRELVLVDGVPTYIPAQRIDGCPVVWPGGSTGGLTTGLDAGDLVIALIRDRSHDEVDNGNATPTEPQSSARCSLADAVVLPAYRVPGTMPASAYRSDGAPVLWADGSLPVRLGTSTAAIPLSRDDLVQAQLTAIQQGFNSLNFALTTWSAAIIGIVGTGYVPPFPVYTPGATDSDRVLVDS